MRSISTLFLRHIATVLLALFISLPGLFAQTHTPKTVAINAASGGYWEYLPVNYSSTTGKYPVLIYISGGNGAFGNGSASAMQIILNQGVPRIINLDLMPKTFTVNGETTSYIIISPQFRYKPSPEEVNNFIDYIIKAYPRIDQTRICLTGFSIGGDVAWKTPYDLASASRLAALVPVAGYNNPYSDDNAQFIAAGKLPVWAIHSNADAAPVGWTISMVNKINSYNPAVPPVLSRPEGLSHEQTHVAVYDPGYKPNGLNIYEWCLQFRRSVAANAPVVNAGADKTITLPANSVTLTGSATDADGGTLTYAWTKISGPAAFAIASPSAASTVVNGLAAGEYQFQLEATDPTGLKGKDTVKVTVLNPPNQSPVANAGQNVTITLPANSVTLSAAGSSDPDGSITAYAWTKISGPAAFSINNATVANPVISGLTAGTYSIQLTVTDNNSATAKDTVVITVNPAPNQPPVANAGADVTITLPQNSVTLNGNGSSDPDGTITSYSWTKQSGPASFTISNASVINPVISNLVAGTYTFQLTVTDNSGATNTDLVTVVVNSAVNQAPVANAGQDITITLPQSSVTLNGSGSSDADGTIVEYHWTKQSGPASYLISNSYVANPVISKLEAGTYVMQLRVIDNSGAVSTDQMVVTVNAVPNQLPVANAGMDITLTLPQNNVTLNGGGSTDPDGSIASYNWTKVSGPSSFSINNANIVNPQLSGLVEGTYSFQLTVTDNSGGTNTDIVTVTVNPAPNQLPVANAGANQTITLPLSSAMLSGSQSTDPDGSIVAYQWSQVAGPANSTLSNATNVNATAGGLIAGTYRFELLVRDNRNATDRDTVEVLVKPATPLGGKRVLKVNIYTGSNPANSEWNNWNLQSSLTLSNAKFADGSSSGISVSLSSSNAVADNGNSYPVTMCPVEVGRTTSYSTILRNLIISGLDNAKQYELEVYSSRSGSGNSTKFTVGSKVVNILSSNNYANKALFTEVAPVSGQIRLIIERLNTYNYVNGFMLTELSDNDEIANQPPVASAGNDQQIQLPVNSVQLNGAGSSDSDGSIVSYSWTKISGPASFSINNATAANPVISNLTAGTYTIELTVTDDKGAVAKDTLTVTVNAAANQLPVANAGNDITITLPQNSVTLNASGSSDPDGTIASYSWTKLSGPASFSISNAAIANPVISNLTAGTYTIQLTVADNAGASAKDTVIVLVNAAQNIAPVANAGSDQALTLPLNTVTLSGTGTDADGSVTAYLWKQISGPGTATLTNATTATATAANLVQGVYRFELTVRDNGNAEAKDTVTITVNAAPASEKIVKVNVYGGSFPAGTEWNNWNVQSNLTYSNLKYSDGTVSAISVSMNLSNAVADNGAGYPVTMCPAEVGRTTSYSTVARYVTLKGLDNAKRYELEVYGSRNGTGNSTKFSVGTTSITILTDRNYTNKAVFSNIMPVSGQIMLSVERLNTYNYINGFILREIGTENALITSRSVESQPAMLSSIPEEKEVTPKVELGTYPNPFRDNLDVQVNNDKAGIMNIVLLNQAGLPVKQLQFNKEQGVFRRSITLQDLQPGIYFLRVQMQGWSKSEKIVKMK